MLRPNYFVGDWSVVGYGKSTGVSASGKFNTSAAGREVVDVVTRGRCEFMLPA